MESTLAIQQFIQQKIRRDFTDIEGILELPLKVDVNVWNYEHLRYSCSPSFESSVGGLFHQMHFQSIYIDFLEIY